MHCFLTKLGLSQKGGPFRPNSSSVPCPASPSARLDWKPLKPDSAFSQSSSPSLSCREKPGCWGVRGEAGVG